MGRRGSKCLTFNSEITTTVGTITYKELLDKISNKEKVGIFTYNPKTFEKYITYDILAEENGLREILSLSTKFGRTEEITLNHPYLVWRDDWDYPEWIEAKDLKIGDKLAVAQSQEVFGDTRIGKNKAALLGYLLGDGGLTSGVKFTNMNSKLIQDIQNILNEDFPDHTIKEITRSNYGFNIIGPHGVSSDRNKVLNWLRDIKEYGKKSKDKRIPECIKKSTKEEIAVFLNRLFACDGFVSIDIPRYQHKIPKISIAITLASRQFILDIQRELLKFGIISSINYIKVKLKDKEFDAWKLSVSQKESILKFAEEINIFQKENKVAKAKEISLTRGDSKTELGYLPRGAWNKILKVKKEKKLTNCFIYGESSYGATRLRKEYKLSKKKSEIYYKNIGDEYLYNLAKSSVCWDTVANITNIGFHKTVALEVKDTNIIGNDIISHNSTIASWVAAYETYKLLKTYHPQSHYGLLPDAEIHLTTIATSEDQANTLFRQILGYFAQSKYFHRYMCKPTNDRVLIRSRRDLDKYGEEGKASIVVKSAPSSARSLRGPGNMVVIMDEQAHFLDDKTESNKSDKAIYDALTPSVAQFKNDGKIINISSPLNKSGVLWDLYNYALTGASNILLIKAPSWEINNTLSPSFLKGRYERDPVSYECEFGAEFSDRVKAWMPEEYLRKIIVPGLRTKRVGKPRTPYFMGLDIGFKEDGPAIAISHVEKFKDEETGEYHDKIEIDYVEARYAGEPPYEDYDVLQFELIADWIEELCKKFYVVKGMLDQHNGVVVSQNLANRGLTQFDLVYHTRAFNSELYQNFMMLTIDRKIRLPNDKPDEFTDDKTIDELLRLQVKQHSKNVIEVAAPRVAGQHDDRPDALVRSVWLAADAIKTGLVSSSLALYNNRYTTIQNANQYQMMKSRIHNIPDNKRAIRRQRLNGWAKKYG